VESSPIATIDQWLSPVLLVKADGDLDVPLQQTIALIEDLRSHNIDHDLIMIPNEIHVMARYASWMTLFNAADAYFDRHLDTDASDPRFGNIMAISTEKERVQQTTERTAGNQNPCD
jgi:dipeptidyl aminopeptidase/acylaminoacyl peptidase